MNKMFMFSFVLVSFIVFNLSECKLKVPFYHVIFNNVTFKITNSPHVNRAIDEENPEICSWGGHKFAVGEVFKSAAECKTVKCVAPGRVEYFDCGSVAFDDDNCGSIGMDMSEKHPRCCHRIQCKEDNKTFTFNPLSPGDGDLEINFKHE